jgi:hypothetical protein
METIMVASRKSNKPAYDTDRFMAALDIVIDAELKLAADEGQVYGLVVGQMAQVFLAHSIKALSAATGAEMPIGDFHSLTQSIWTELLDRVERFKKETE